MVIHIDRLIVIYILGSDFVYSLIKSNRNHVNMEFWESQFEKAGSRTFEVSLGGQRMIMTDDPENIKAILATQFKDFGKGETFHRDWHEFLGDSIFTTDLDQWHDSRQLIRPQFIKDRVSDLETFERHVAKLLEKMGGDGSTVDLKGLLFRYTLDAATDFLLGKSVGSLDSPQVRRKFRLDIYICFGPYQGLTKMWIIRLNLPKHLEKCRESRIYFQWPGMFDRYLTLNHKHPLMPFLPLPVHCISCILEGSSEGI